MFHKILVTLLTVTIPLMGQGSKLGKDLGPSPTYELWSGRPASYRFGVGFEIQPSQALGTVIGNNAGIGGAEANLMVKSLQNYLNNSPNLSDFREGGAIEKLIMEKLNPTTANLSMANYVAANWLLAAHLLRSADPSLGSSDTRALLNKAWGLTYEKFNGGLATPFDDRARTYSAWMAGTWLRIAIALSDVKKMEEALSPLREELIVMPQSEKVNIFIAALHTGQIGKYRQYFAEWPPERVSQSHERALFDPNQVDYLSILNLIKKESFPTIDAKQLDSGPKRVGRYAARLKSAQGSDSARVTTARTVFSGWQTVDKDLLDFQMLGGVVHWFRPGKHGIPLSGIRTQNTLDLAGFVDLPSGEVRSESWSLKRIPGTSRWAGELVQNYRAGNEERLTLVFETEVELLPY